MSESLGLSIGVANLVAARAGGAPVMRRSVLTLFDQRPSEVGLPEENPNLTEPGLVIRGFVERVGDRAPLVAADGTKYLGDALTVEALEVMTRTVGHGTPVIIAVPAYWSEAQIAALRDEFFAQPSLAPEGVRPALISDAITALAALRTQPGFPNQGIVAVCDFGAGGTSITLFDAGSSFAQVGSSVRDADFSGERIDQLILGYVQGGAADATSLDLGSTTRLSSQARLLDDCRRAKEQLSTVTVTTIAGAQLSRSDLEQLTAEPLQRFVANVEESLQRNGISRANLAAVAAVGGGAGIPALTARLSERLRVPVITAPQPACCAAVGAAVLGQQQSSPRAATAASPVLDAPTGLVGAPATELAPTVPAGGRRPPSEGVLAWSEDGGAGGEPVPYTGRDATGEYGRERPGSDYAGEQRYPAAETGLPWYKRTALVLSVAGALAAVLVAVVLALTLGHSDNPVNPTPPTEPAPQTPETVTVTGPNNSPTVTVVQPPPASTTTQPATTTTTQPPTTTTTTQPPTTTTTQAPTTSSAVTTTEPPPPTRERRPFEWFPRR